MRARTVGWVAGSAAAASAALIIGTVVLAYVDRHRVHGNLTSWDFSDVFGYVTSLALPVVGFVLATKRHRRRSGTRIQLLVIARRSPLAHGVVAFRFLAGALSADAANGTDPPHV